MYSNYAILTGICASAGSIFGKLVWLPIFADESLLRICFIGLMFLSNTGVWILFVKALQEYKSSLIPTVISTASNYIFSALAGFLLFGEATSLIWWSGLLFIIIGILLILDDQAHTTEIEKEE